MDKSQIKKIVDAELTRGKYPFPPELIHAIIKVESNWKPGVVNPKSGATGLMQVMPVVVSDYNKTHKTSINMSDISKSTDYSARLQVRIGLWVLGVFWRGAFRYLQPRTTTVPIDELVKIADMYYVAGPGATRKKLDQLAVPTSAAVAQRWPEWVALNHVKAVWNLTDSKHPTWNLAAIDNWVGKGTKPTIAGFDDHLGGFVLGAIILILGWQLLAKKGKET